MKYVIDEIEKALESGTEWTWMELGISGTLGDAYLYSREAGNEIPNFGETIWDEEIKAIIDGCRRLGIREFTISSGFSGLIDTIAKLEDSGCRLDGIVKIRERYTHFGRKEHDLIPALKMTVRETEKEK